MLHSFSIKHGIIFSMVFVVFGTFAISADGQTNVIPDWVKNTAKWWSNDQISETEYISSLQYLIDTNIIAVDSSISSVYATDVSISNEERAQSFQVTISSEQYAFDETYHTFIQFINRDEAAGQPSGVLSKSPSSPEFILGSLPSSDKKLIYEHIQKTMEPGAQVSLLELQVDVSILTGDGTILQTWEYEDCTLLDYVVFLAFDKEDYRWGPEDTSEIRELFLFQCKGLEFTV